MKFSISLTIALAFSFNGFSQDAQDVLKGERCKSGDIYFDKELNHRVHNRSETFISLEDSTVIMVPKVYTVHIQAYNPLHYTHNNGIKVSLDPIQSSILASIEYILESDDSDDEELWFEESWYKATWRDSIGVFSETKDEKNDFKEFIEDLSVIEKKIKKDKSKECLRLTKELIKLTFKNESKTLSGLDNITGELDSVEAYYAAVTKALVKFKFEVEHKKEEVNGQVKFLDPNWHTLKYINESLARIDNVKLEQEKRISNLKGLLSSIKEVMQKWESSYFDNRWFIVVQRRRIDHGDIHSLEIGIEKHVMSIENEKIKKEEGKKKSKMFRVRKFNRFVAEISAGTIYTFQDYPRYTTEKNLLSEDIVAEVEGNKLERIELTAMLNFNMYLPNSSILPFIQLGLGVSSDVPVGLLGGGLRFDLGKKRVIALSGGLSITGIKELQNLNIGDIVIDNLEVENDVEYQLSPVKPYFGIQYNF